VPSPKTEEVARIDLPAARPEPERRSAAAGPARADASVLPPRSETPDDRVTPARDLLSNDGIADVLMRLETAYEKRDAKLAKAVWPTVNERALARAFDGLRSQSVTFDRCKLNVSGASGEVECRGVTTYVPRVGLQYERSESRQWRIRVQRGGGDRWVITSAAAR
jgi:hypothetical protein